MKRIASVSLSALIIVLLLWTDACPAQWSGNAYSFTSATSTVTIPYNLFFQTQTLEISFSIDPALTGNGTLITDGRRYNLRVVKTGPSTFLIEYLLKCDTSWISIRSKTPLTYGSWHNVAVQYDTSGRRIWLDGGRDEETPSDNPKLTNLFNEVNHHVGCNPDLPDETFRGLIDEVRFWTVPIPPDVLEFWRRSSISSDSRHPYWADLACYLECDVDPSGGYVHDSRMWREGSCTGVKPYVFPNSSVYATSAYTFPSDYYQNYFSPKSTAVFFNNRLHLFTSHGGNQPVRSTCGTIDDANHVVMDPSTFHQVGQQYELPFACCTYKTALLYVSMMNLDESLSIPSTATQFSHVGSLDSDGDVTADNVSRDISTCVPSAMAVMNDTVYLFSLVRNGSTFSLNAEWSVDGKTWTFLRTVKDNSDNTLDYSHGNIAACTGRNASGNETIFLGYIEKSHNQIHLLEFHRDSQTEARVLSVPKVSNFSIVSGTVEGGMSSGYTLQLFFRADTADRFGNSATIGRIEYSIDKHFAYPAEHLQISGTDYSNGTFEHQMYWPHAFAYYQTLGSSSNVLGKKIVLAVGNKTTSGNQNLSFLVWNSDRMTYIPERDTTDTTPSESISQLLGVIEGAPPYVLNGEDLGELVKYHTYPSFLEFGSSQSSSTDSSVSMSRSWSVSFRYEGIGADFEGQTQKESQTEYTEKTAENRLVFPVEGRPRGYRVFLRPIITRRKFELTDPSGRWLDDIYTLEISDRFIDYVPYALDTVQGSPNPVNFSSYMHRMVDPGGYKKLYSANYSWTGGNESTVSFETDSTVTTRTEEEFYKGAGVSVNVDMGGGIGVEMSTTVFEFESKVGMTSRHEGSTSMSHSRNISITTDCPFHGIDGDTAYFSGTIYWIKPTAGKNNWWVPKGFEAQEPWCITYKVNSYATHPTSVEGPAEIGSPDMVALYPNPAGDMVAVTGRIPWATRGTLVVYNVFGREVLRSEGVDMSDGRSTRLVTRHLPSGTYHMVIDAAGRTCRKTFVIAR